MASNWEAEVDGFFNSVQGAWRDARARSAEGQGPLTQVEKTVYPITDQELIDAGELYFSALGVITPVLDQLDVWTKSIAATVAPIRTSVELYRQSLSQNRHFAAAVETFSCTTTNLERAQDALVKTSVPRLKAQFFLPMKAELSNLNNLRVRAVKLCYKVEQLIKANNDPTLRKMLGKAKPEWQEKAQAELDLAKPTYIEAIHAFMPRFHQQMLDADRQLVQIKKDFFAQLGELQRQSHPQTAPIDYTELDRILSIVRPKL
jgi:hypothetical protein